MPAYEEWELGMSSVNKKVIEWHNVWVRAINNMPRNSRGQGQAAALCLLLGYPLRRIDGHGQYSAHNRIYTNMYRGCAPRDAGKRKRLLRLAQPDGMLVAWLTLCKMGYGKKYTQKG